MSKTPAKALRWILLPMVAVGAWYVAFFIGLMLRGAVYKIAFPWCRDKQVISDDLVCMDPWFNPLVDTAMYVGAGLAAFLIIVSCVGIAPAHKRIVARVVYAAGAMVAIVMGVSIGGADGYLSMVAAIGVGALTTAWLSRRYASAHVA